MLLLLLVLTSSFCFRSYGFFCCRASYFVVDKPEKSRAVFERLRAGGNYPQVCEGRGGRRVPGRLAWAWGACRAGQCKVAAVMPCRKQGWKPHHRLRILTTTRPDMCRWYRICVQAVLCAYTCI